MRYSFKEQDLFHWFDEYGIPLVQAWKGMTMSMTNRSINRSESGSLLDEVNEILNRNYIHGDFLLRYWVSSESNWQISVPDDWRIDEKRLTDLAIKYVLDTTGLRITDLATLVQWPTLNDRPFFLIVSRDGCDYAILARKVVNGNLIIRQQFNPDGRIQQNFIKSLGSIRKINGSLGIDGVMSDLGDLEEVNGSLWFSNHIYQEELKSLHPLKIVHGDLNLKNTHASLESLVEVKGNLNLRKTTCANIENLRRVGGNILVSKSQVDQLDFTSVEVIGKIRAYNDEFNKGSHTPPSS